MRRLPYGITASVSAKDATRDTMNAWLTPGHFKTSMAIIVVVDSVSIRVLLDSCAVAVCSDVSVIR